MHEYLLVFAVALATTYLLATVARELAMRVGAYAKVRDRDVHEVPIPYFGGVAMLGGLGAGYAVATQLPRFSAYNLDFPLFEDVRAALAGGAVICLVGVVDDIFELDALTKFAGEVLAAVVTVALGIQMNWIPLPSGSDMSTFSLGSLGAVLAVLFIVATVNAVNFVDGLDGLAAGMVGIGAVTFFAYSVVLITSNAINLASAAALLTAALAGACFGFLPHNFSPAKMFMGDSGALLIGFVLASAAISVSGSYSQTNIRAGIAGAAPSLVPAALPLVIPVAMLAVPFLDMLLAVIRRTRAGRSPFSPDRKHLHHRLLEVGHTQRRAVLVMYLWTASFSFAFVGFSLYTSWLTGSMLVLLALLAFVATVAVPRRHGHAVAGSDEARLEAAVHRSTGPETMGPRSRP